MQANTVNPLGGGKAIEIIKNLCGAQHYCYAGQLPL